MVINENNSQINAFVKGMNSDTAYDHLDNQQYVYAKNVRITKNDSINNSSTNNFSSVHEGAVTPVPAGVEEKHNNGVVGRFLGSDSIGEIAVVVTINDNNQLCVYRAKINNNPGINDQTEQPNLYTAGFTLWWSCNIHEEEKQNEFNALKAVSTVAYQELEGVIKLYIATGIYPIIEIRIDDNSGPYSGKQDVDYFINNRILPIYPVYIENKIDGSLKTSQVQYTYRYYNKFGTTTQLAPLTNKIQVIDSNRSKETGNAQDTTTSVGFTLKIRNTNNYSAYNRLQIYRLSYIVPGEDANVALIYDGDVDTKTEGVTSFSFNDVGTTPLQELTMQEFAAMSGMVIIPKVIEQNQQYMFAANVKDDTIISGVHLANSTKSLQNTFSVTLSTTLDDKPTQKYGNSAKFSEENILQYFKDRSINENLPKNSYDDIFTSSLLRSLRRGESYRYGIVYYDKYGRHTNVQDLGSIAVPEINQSNFFANVSNSELVAKPIGVTISIPQLLDKDNNVVSGIVGCQIVRRSSKSIYQNILIQVALAKPVAQDLYITTITASQWDAIRNGQVPSGVVSKMSPNYPSGFLLSNPVTTVTGYYKQDNHEDDNGGYFPAYSRDNNLYQAFSNEFDFRRNDIMSTLMSQTADIHKICNYTLSNNSATTYNAQYKKYIDSSLTGFDNTNVFSKDADSGQNIGEIKINKKTIYQSPSNKINEHVVFPLFYYNYSGIGQSKSIKATKDVKLAQWYDGFSNVQIDGVDIAAGGIKKYQSFTTTIDGNTFNNWVSFGLYGLRISPLDSEPNQPEHPNFGVSQFIGVEEYAPSTDLDDTTFINIPQTRWRHDEIMGYIGPGPSCFLFTINDNSLIQSGFGAQICNITHDISTVQNEPDEFIQYFGFGNFFPLDENYNIIRDGQEAENRNNTATVFDGDIYITPHELTTMYKTYDFMSSDTLYSMQVTNYVPMESKVNTFFDYGMNFLNTDSANLIIEPGSIDGITTQDRPVHQYNQIYSANDESNDVFTLVVEKAEDNNFKQRTYYSEPKTNGEYVDNFVIFKPAAYIDVDPKYGEVTNLLTDKNTLYYWQNTAFGKFSVNERSLINDTNGNTIMLGQAGILSRNDYISTKYGMRPFDYCATCAENGVYWVDVNNRAVVGGNSNECVNLGETLNVQNIINAKISENVPRVDYDLQNNELLCKCFDDGEQIVFNLKHKMATSVYNRNYEDIISIQNHIYGYINDDSKDIITRYNYLKSDTEFMSPMQIDFVVNHASSTTKVFDSQQLVPMKRKGWLSTNREDETTYFEDSLGTNGSLSFETDINSTTNTIQPYTDREGNIIYNIPRFGNGDWGNRLRGKWMRVNMNYATPTEYTTISHVITKFRQSYS